MSLRFCILTCLVVCLCSIALLPARAADDVSIQLSEGILQVKTPAYQARLGSDGNLHSFRVGGVEMLDDQTSFSLGAFFYADKQPKRLATVTFPAGKVRATDGTLTIEYSFLPGEIRLSLSQTGTTKLPFFIILSKDIATATDTRSGSIAPTPTEAAWPDVTFTARTGAYITLRGGDRIWGPWSERQVWELGPLEAGVTREVSITPGVGAAPQQTPAELLTLTLATASADQVLHSGEPATLTVTVDNRGDILSDALLTVTLKGNKNAPATEVSQTIAIPAKSRVPTRFDIALIEPGVYTAQAVLSLENKPVKDASTILAFRPEDIKSKVTLPSDYIEFWKTAAAEAKLAPGEALPELDEVPSQSTSEAKVWTITFKDIKGEKLSGWLCIPNRPGHHPAVLQLPGYGRPKVEPPMMLASRGYVALAVNLVVEGADTAYFAHELEDPRSYPYRQIVTNALRAFDLLLTRPEVDPRRVAVTGAGQGGGIAIIVASLRPSVAAVIADSPLLCDFPHSIAAGGWPYSEIAQYLQSHSDTTTRVASTLSYFDALNAAPYVRQPVLFSLGLKDATCLPETIYAAYNGIAGTKDIKVYADAGHEAGGSPEHWTYKLQWLDDLLKPSVDTPTSEGDKPAVPPTTTP